VLTVPPQPPNAPKTTKFTILGVLVEQVATIVHSVVLRQSALLQLCALETPPDKDALCTQMMFVYALSSAIPMEFAVSSLQLALLALQIIHVRQIIA